jgi:hypothetical protein
MNELSIMHHELDLSHVTKDACPFELVEQVETPQPLDRWYPIPHATLVDCFMEQMDKTDLKVVQECYTLARNGQRFFALFQVEGIKSPHSSEVGTVIGLRNSHDKSFRAAICAGCAPFVCTNLAFSNEIVLGRRHTTNIMADLPKVISRAIGKLSEHWAANDNRIDAYKGYQLDNQQADHLIIEMFLSGAIMKTHIADVAKQWRDPDNDEFAERNGWSLYNAATNVLRGNLTALNDRSDALHGLLDVKFGVHAA